VSYKPPAPRYIGPAAQHGGKVNKPIKRIVIHCTVSSCCDSAVQIARYFRQTTRFASAHYVVDAEHTIQSLYDSYVAYHAPPNENSLGVELCCTLADEGKGHWGREDHKKMLKRAARLVAELCLAYDVPVRAVSGRRLRAGMGGICGHNAVRDAWGQTTHWDPGPHFPWRTFIAMVKAEVEAIQKPQRKSTRVRKARVKIASAIDLLLATAKKRRKPKRIARHLKDDLARLPKQ
jgi:N-acetylmuramoyl-L-alanine amidase CwlA